MFWPFKKKKLVLPPPSPPTVRIEGPFRQGSSGAAGFDLHIAAACDILGFDKVKLKNRVAIPFGHFGLLVGRSSASKRGLIVLPGVIDSDYRGPLYASLYAPGPSPVQLSMSDPPLVQLLIIPLSSMPTVEGVVFSHETDRGEGGFGSTDGPAE